MNTRSKTPRTPRHPLLRPAIVGALLAASAGSLLAPRASAATRAWGGAAGDTLWSTSSNWSPAGEPVAGDTALITGGPGFPLGAGWTVTYDYTGPSITLNSLTVSHSNSKVLRGSNVLNMGNVTFLPSLTANVISVGDSSTGGTDANGIFNLNGGFNFVQNSLTLGQNAADNGSYNLSNSSLLQAPLEYVGEHGFGSITQSSAFASNNLLANGVAPSLTLGDQAGANGSYALQAGELNNWNGFEIIGNLGTGNFTQTGGLNEPTPGSGATNTLIIAQFPGSNGTYNLQGGTLTADTVYLNYDGGNAAFNHSAGNLTLTSNTTTPTLYVGVGPGGSANYTLSDPATLTANNNGQEIIGTSTSSFGNFTQTGGTNTLNSFSTGSPQLILGFTAGATGNYTLSNGSLTVNHGVEFVGYSGAGTFTQSGANSVNTTASLVLGAQANSFGTYNFNDGTLVSTGNEYVGNSGLGFFTQSGGANTITGGAGLIISNSANTESIFVFTGGSFDAAFIQVNTTGHFNYTGGTLTLNTLFLNGGNASLQTPFTQLTALTFAGSTNNWLGQLDLSTCKLILHPSSLLKSISLANAQNQVLFARTHSTGITSFNLPAHDGIAVLDNAITHFTTFGGQPVDPGSILIAPELLGDANVDGHVDLTDLSTVLNNFGTTTPNWTSGNFDGQPTIDLTDLSAVLNNFGLSNPNASSSVLSTQSSALPAPTPEPASLILLLAGSVVLRTHRVPKNRQKSLIIYVRPCS